MLAALLLGAGCAHTSSSGPAEAPAVGEVPEATRVDLEEGRFVIEADGASVFSHLMRFRVGEGDAQRWRTLSASRELQSLRVRLTLPDGRSQSFGPEDLVEIPLDPGRPEGPTRTVVPLPDVVPGALIERETVSAKPGGRSGAYHRFNLASPLPVDRMALTIDVPVGLPVAVEVRGIELEPQVEEAEGRRRIRYVREGIPPAPPAQKYLPPNLPLVPHVAFSTTLDWKTAAAGLQAAVEVASKSPPPLLNGLPADALRPQLVREALARTELVVRKTGRLGTERPLRLQAPQLTLDAGRGNDADLSLLLVAMLRGRGLDAKLALVKEGLGEDIRPDLPTLEVFDRALVRIDGPAPLWVDPLAPFVPPGELPPTLQGRWALVVGPGSTQLEPTPRAASIDNTYLEERTYTLTEDGGANVVETTHASGSLGTRLRMQVASPETREEGMARYVANQYRGAELGKVRVSDPRDLGTPIEVEIEARHASVGPSTLLARSVTIGTAVLFGWLPELVRDAALASPDAPESREDEMRQVAAMLVDRRERPLVFPEPYSAELRFEVKPPPGFGPAEPPENQSLELGPARYSARFHQVGDGIHGAVRFDIGPGTHQADELATFVEALRELWHGTSVRVGFEHRGATALREGHIEEGIRTFAELAEAHPDSAIHHARLALGLVQAGLGDAARQVAREAVELDASSVEARYVLGHVLSHDLVGRHLAPGFDRAGAMDAFRLVKALDPGHVRARAELAVLRSTDERGLRFRDPAGLEGVVAEYRSLRSDLGVTAFDEELIEALFRAERFEEVLMEAERADRSLERDAHVVAAKLALGATVEEATGVLDVLGVPEEARGLVLAAAATSLAGVGRYPEARDLLARVEERSSLGPLAKQADRLATIEPLERLLRPDGDPARVVQQLLARVVAGEVQAEDLRELYDSSWSPELLKLEAERLTRAFGSLSRLAHRAHVPSRVLRDGILSSTEYRVEGQLESGFRVRALIEGDRPTYWFVRPEPSGGLRVFATGFSPDALGRAALSALDAGKTAVAEQWLVWADELVVDPRGGSEDPFGQLPYPALRARAPERLRWAALALAGLGPHPEGALASLEAVEAPAELGDLIANARLIALISLGRWSEVAREVTPLSRRHPGSASLRSMSVAALLEQGRWAAASTRVKDLLAAHPGDPELLAQLANVETARGRWSSAEAILERLATDDADSVVYNNLAWVALFRGHVEDRDLERAKRAATMSEGRSPTELHTLAALHAERGDAAETVELVRRRLELRDADAPESVDYYLFGRVMEHFGLPKLAARAYLQVEPEEGDRADSTHALAQKRLRALR